MADRYCGFDDSSPRIALRAFGLNISPHSLASTPSGSGTGTPPMVIAVTNCSSGSPNWFLPDVATIGIPPMTAISPSRTFAVPPLIAAIAASTESNRLTRIPFGVRSSTPASAAPRAAPGLDRLAWSRTR